jgi:hypothetical protein
MSEWQWSIKQLHYVMWVRVMVFNATFNNISGISWWSVLLVGNTGVREENQSHCQTLTHNVVSSTPRLSRIRVYNFSVIGADCKGSCKPNYHTITTTTTSVYVVLENQVLDNNLSCELTGKRVNLLNHD